MSTAGKCSAVKNFEEIYGIKFPQYGPPHRINTTQARISPLSREPAPMIAEDSVRRNTSLLDKMRMTQANALSVLRMIREPLVDYQESRGIPRNEIISFVTLLTSLCTHAYTAALTILVMLWNLAPLLDGFIYFIRFILDKMIDIVETEDPKDKVMKSVLFCFEVIIVTFLMFLIMGLIFMPVLVLTTRIFSKIWSMIAW